MKARQTILFLRTFWTGRTYFLSAPFIVAEAQHHEESHLIHGALASTLLDQGFPVEHELDACNPPQTMRNFSQTSSYLISGQHFLETFMLLSYNNQDHTFMGDYIIPVLNQQRQPFATPMATIFHSDIQQCDAHFAQAFSCYNSFSVQ